MKKKLWPITVQKFIKHWRKLLAPTETIEQELWVSDATNPFNWASCIFFMSSYIRHSFALKKQAWSAETSQNLKQYFLRELHITGYLITSVVTSLHSPSLIVPYASCVSCNLVSAEIADSRMQFGSSRALEEEICGGRSGTSLPPLAALWFQANLHETWRWGWI